MKRQVRRYNKEFKEGAIKLALKSSSITNTAKELGLPVGTLHTWLQQLKEKADLSPASQSTASQDMCSLLEENRRLHKELSIVKEEKEILKKAAACVP